MEELTEINKISVKVSKHQHYNTSQGILNVYDYNFKTFKTGLAEELGVRDVQKASCIQ